MTVRTLGIIAIISIGLTGVASVRAQSCDAEWDTDIGNPGLQSDGYIAPIVPWKDPTGQALYIGGAFSRIGGVTTNNIIRWDPAAKTWTKLGKGCYTKNTNSFVTSIAVYDSGSGEELFVGGGFQTANDVSGTANLARWNGKVWSKVGTINGAVWSLAVWNGKLYVGGGFTKVGSLTVNGIASWDGQNWSAVGSGFSGGYSPAVFSLYAFDDGSGEKLYAGGRFDTIGGVKSVVARWNGSDWEKPGDGLQLTSSIGDIECMAAFDDGGGAALYVGGAYFRAKGGSETSTARWDGNTWKSVGQDLGGRTTALIAFNDGAGPALYNGGTAQPDIGYFARLSGDDWLPVDSGVGGPSGPPWPSVFGLGIWRDRLFVGGYYGWVGTEQLTASGIAARRACVRGDLDCDGLVDFNDIDPFVLALSDPALYDAEYPDCNIARADTNHDDHVDFNDIDAFVDCLTNGGCE